MRLERQDIPTSHGPIAVEMTEKAGPDVVFIHGNSSCRHVFHHQFVPSLCHRSRFIRFDLPGHGESSDAVDPARTYPLPGLAEATIELLDCLRVNAPILVGWSLGGHIAMEMLAQSYEASGVVLIGAPPVGAAVAEGFRGNFLSGLAGRGRFSADDASLFVAKVFGPAADPCLVQAAMRTDESFRSTLFSSARFAEKSDQRVVMRDTPVATAIINGADDPVVDLDYIDSVPVARLWRSTCFRLPQAGHAPFLQTPKTFNALLSAFFADGVTR